MLDVLFAGVKTKHYDLLNFVFEDLNYGRKNGRVDLENCTLGLSLSEDGRDLLDKLIDAFLSELPPTMERFDCAFFAEERKHGVGFGLERGLYISVAKALACNGRFGSSHSTLSIVVLCHSVEVDRLMKEGRWYRLIIDVLSFECALARTGLLDLLLLLLLLIVILAIGYKATILGIFLLLLILAFILLKNW